MGTRGPIPERTDQVRRRNKKDVDAVEVDDAAPVEAPAPDDDWHEIAREWFEALADSGQAVFYEPSDWATARLIAESMSRDLNEQPIGVDERTGRPVMARIPLKGASLAAYLKACGVLGVTEGDRRRLQIELHRGERMVDPEEERAGATITDIAAKLAAGGG